MLSGKIVYFELADTILHFINSIPNAMLLSKSIHFMFVKEI